jgi:ankyrin repeat protein
MLVRSLEMQCGARAAHAARREDFRYPEGDTIRGSTQLVRAVVRNDLPRVLQLVQLGAPLDATDRSYAPYSALHWACCKGHERVAETLLDGEYEGRGANIDLLSAHWTPLMIASSAGREGVVRLLLARGAR